VDFLQTEDSVEQVDEVDDAADLNMTCSDVREVDPVSYRYFLNLSSANRGSLSCSRLMMTSIIRCCYVRGAKNSQV